MANHYHWAIRRCGGDPTLMRQQLKNIVRHYANEHSGCDKASRCNTDPNYEPSRQVVLHPEAQKLLETAIVSSLVYKAAEDFTEAKETDLVESFNNMMNIFHHKRISMTDKEYLLRAMVATLNWNENCDRPATSVRVQQATARTKRRKVKKNYKTATYMYRDNIWRRYMDMLFA